jgi:hypothetical protein
MADLPTLPGSPGNSLFSFLKEKKKNLPAFSEMKEK